MYMEEYKIRILPQAQIDALDIVEHLNSLAPEAAEQYYDRFVAEISLLAEKPESSMPAKDTQLRLRGYRTVQISDYLVFYVVKANIVELRRILYANRQYEQLY